MLSMIKCLVRLKRGTLPYKSYTLSLKAFLGRNIDSLDPDEIPESSHQAHSVDPDQLAFEKPADQDTHCLSFCL